MAIFQGEIYWIDLGEPQGSEPAYLRPCVVVQNDVLNQSQISTVIVCALTTNLRRAKAIGNVLLAENEANLPESSVVNVSQVFTVDKHLLTESIGTDRGTSKLKSLCSMEYRHRLPKKISNIYYI